MSSGGGTTERIGMSLLIIMLPFLVVFTVCAYLADRTK